MGRTTVLVVEDDARVASVIADQLREEDHVVETASDVRSAVRALTDVRPDVLVLDVMLPDGSGFDLCRRIRQGGGSWDAGVGILLLTARGEDVDVIRGFDRGADDYLR
jgi:DNA-binding response OmpR family regulator